LAQPAREECRKNEQLGSALGNNLCIPQTDDSALRLFDLQVFKTALANNTFPVFPLLARRFHSLQHGCAHFLS